MATEISESNFDETVMNAANPVLVDFWAPWCRPCRAISPLIDEMAREYEGKLSVYKLNVDDNPKIPEKFSIRAIPTVIVFKNGEPADRVTGAVSKGSLKEMIDKVLG